VSRDVELTGTVAMVTEAAGGIGSATVRTLVEWAGGTELR
jgi:hypothetical protein